jgi:plastocyanin
MKLLQTISQRAQALTRPQRFLIFLVAAAIISLSAGALVYRNDKSVQAPVIASDTPSIAMVEVTPEGFMPAVLTVSKGTVVEWQSTDETTTHLVASDPFPKDNGLAGLKSSQLGNGAVYRFAFANAGTYHYHDDLNPTTSGTVIVK